MFSRFFIDRPIFAAVISIVIVILGGVALVALPIDRYPQIAPPVIQIQATYPGADAETIAETVATPIEQEVNGVEGMLYMTSTSSADGTMSLLVTFDTDMDLDMANVLTQNRVALAEPKLPEEVRRLGVSVKKRSTQITFLVNFFSPDNRYDEVFLNNFATLRVRDELTRVAGVGEVMIFGAEYGMRIWLDPDRMRSLNLTVNDVIAGIREQNVEVAAGQIGEPPAPAGQVYQMTVTTLGRLSDPEQFENIIIKTGEQGRVIRIKDVARVELGSQNYNLSSQLNGRPTSTMAVYQLPDANAIEVADTVRAKLEELSRNFPEGLEYQISFDFTDVIRASLKEVVITLFITLALVVFTVYVFLQNVRATLIPAVTIPVSLVGTFIVMAALGYSLNILTLFGLILVIGIVVDDAIVVVENTSRLIQDGMKPRDAAVKSMQEVTGPVIATTLVLLAVFVPTIFLGGISGQLFRQFAVTISIATVFSSINALTLSPPLCALLLRPRAKRGALPFRLFNRGLAATTTGYTGLVRGGLRLAALCVVAFAGLVVLAVWGLGSLPTGFVPQEDEGYFLVNVQLPDGASKERTQAVVDRVNAILKDTPGVKDYVAITGFAVVDESRVSNAAGIFVMLDHWDDRKDPEVMQTGLLRRLNGQFAEIQEGIVIAFPMPSLPGLGNSGGFALQLQNRGGGNLSLLQNVANEMVADGNGQAGLAGMFTTMRANVPQLFLDIDREQVKTMGIPLQQVFDALAGYMGSVYVNDFLRFGKIYQVRAQAEPQFRASGDQIRRIEVSNRSGNMVPLGTVIEVEESFGPQVVTHFNIYPSARINGVPAPGYSSGQAMALVEHMAEQKLPSGIGFEWTELSYQEKAATGSAALTFVFSIVLVYLVLAAQYESWSVPLAVVLGVPTALLGAVAGALLRGFDANVYTQIGIVFLIGLSAKTAILIVEFAKVQREQGLSIFDAAVEASRLRFRAVLMTAFSFILGVIPLLIATGAGAASRQVLGTVVFTGMLVATLFGVLTVPILFYVIRSFSERFSRKTRQP